MTHAYDEMYIDTAMNNLGEAFDYVKNDLKMDLDKFFNLFISTGVAREFEIGNISIITGMSGIELAEHVFNKAGYKIFNNSNRENINKTVSFWCGWILAYYAWYTKRSFENISMYIKIKDIEKLYKTLHEAPEDKFIDVINNIIKNNPKQTKLQMIRKNNSISQSKLSKISGVSLRSIQMYEQRNKDINKAQFITIYNLSRALGCRMEDLIEY